MRHERVQVDMRGREHLQLLQTPDRLGAPAAAPAPALGQRRARAHEPAHRHNYQTITIIMFHLIKQLNNNKKMLP